MKNLLKISGLGILFLLLSCKEETARKPISYSSGEFIKESVTRNKELVNSEEEMIKNLIKKDSAHKYYQSTSGFWYKYIKANIQDTLTPKSGNVVDIEFEIQDVNGTVIYKKEETTPKVYVVDKQEIMVGLRHAIKLMRKDETISFIFPSHMGYGYLGDKDRIGLNEPLVCVVTLKNIRTEKDIQTPPNQ